MAAVYRVAGHDDRAVQIAQALLGASLCLLVAWLGSLLFDRRSALLAAWLVAVYPIFLMLTERLLAENLFTWLVTAAFACAVWLVVSPSTRTALLLGAICGFAALTRSIGLGLAVVLAAVFVFSARDRVPDVSVLARLQPSS